MNNSDCIKLDTDEVEECSLGLEYGRRLEAFKVKEEGEHLVASKWRWDDWQRQRTSQEEEAWKGSRRLEEEDERKWCAAFEDAAKRLVKPLEDSEDLKVGLGELKEQLETPEEASFSIVQITNQARNERGQKLFQIFRQEENEVYIASSARCDTQLKGLVELVDLMKEVELVCERQEGLTGMVVSKKDMQKEAPKKYHEKGFRGIQGVRGAKGKKKLWSSYKRSIC